MRSKSTSAPPLLFIAFAAALVAPGRSHAQLIPQQPVPSAETPAPPPAPSTPPIRLDVRGAEGVDAEALRSSLEQDLGVHVELSHRGARVIIEAEGGVIRMRVLQDEGEVTRETPAAGDQQRLTVTLSLLLSNLLRDESASLLGTLRVPAPAVQAEPYPAAPPEAPVEEEVPVPVPEPEPISDPPPTNSELPYLPFGVDLVPGVGFSSGFFGSERRGVSLGVAGALAGEIEGVALSGAFDIAVGDVRGAQLAGALAIAGGDVAGFQAGGALGIVGGEMDGLSLSGAIGVLGGPLRGAQLNGAIGVVGGGVDGLQSSGALSIAGGSVDGVQLAGAIAIAGGSVHGLQMSVMNFAGAEVDGAQLGVTNVAGSGVNGLQLGIVNVAGGPVRGAQIGLINISEQADAAIGLINVHGRGRTSVRAGVDTNGFLNADLVHGGQWSHSIVHVGVLPFLTHATVAVGIGYGGRAVVADALHLDFELVASVLLDETLQSGPPDALYETRIVAGIALADEITLNAGLSYRWHLTTQPDEAEMGAPILEHDIIRDSDVLLRGWPAIIAGVEFF